MRIGFGRHSILFSRLDHSLQERFVLGPCVGFCGEGEGKVVAEVECWFKLSNWESGLILTTSEMYIYVNHGIGFL